MDREKLLEVLVKANEFKEGDLLVGGTGDDLERREARDLLAGLPLGGIAGIVLVDDGVSEALQRSVDPRIASEISTKTVGELKRILLGRNGSGWVRRCAAGLSSEQIAAIVKLMTNEELSALCRVLFNPLPGTGVSIGSPNHLGSRIQPNSPADNEDEILMTIFEGLSYGCGDVILGINPASDDVETIIRLEKLLLGVRDRLALPTRCCVLSDIVKQTFARVRTPVDVGFQSLAGTSSALYGMVGLDVEGLLDLARGFDGLYFETGQGSAVTNHAAEGVDMVTLEARNYGLARYIRQQTGAWMIVNDVAGFIGPEVFRTADQLLRVCLEDAAMARLHGLTMGLDVCSTFHMGIHPGVLKSLTREVVQAAAPAYLMSIAGNADPMLGYLTTSFREHAELRHRTGKRIASAMQHRLMELNIMRPSGELIAGRPDAETLYAVYMKAGGDTRSFDALKDAGNKKMAALRRRGFDLGYGHGTDFEAPAEVDSRMETVYAQASRALYAALDASVIRDVSPRNLRVRTLAKTRDDYLSHPPSGESLLEADAARVRALQASARRPRIRLIVSDGLNADAANENLRAVLPPVRHLLVAAGFHPGETDIIVTNGRVRAGYQIGGLLHADVVIHLIGERPGTGLNTLSAYLTYGLDAKEQWRWSPAMDHSLTTAICGIHPHGKPPAEAAEEIVFCVARMIREKRSGVELGRPRKP